MQRWGSDLGGTYGAGHDRHIGQNIHGDMAIYPPPWAKHAPEDRYAAPNFGNSHEGFRGSYNGNLETVQPGAWPYGGANLGQSSGRYDANLATSKYTSKRSMPVHAVTQMLSARAGHTVEPGNICANLYDLFGDKSSVTCKEIVHTVFNGLRSKVLWAVTSLSCAIRLSLSWLYFRTVPTHRNSKPWVEFIHIPNVQKTDKT